MSRLFPRSLFGQTLLILLAGLVVSHAVGSWIYTADREQAVRAVGGFATAQRIANLTRLVQDTPPEARQRIVAALSDQSFRVSLSAQADSQRQSRTTTHPLRRRSGNFWSISCRLVPRGSRACRASAREGLHSGHGMGWDTVR